MSSMTLRLADPPQPKKLNALHFPHADPPEDEPTANKCKHKADKVLGHHDCQSSLLPVQAGALTMTSFLGIDLTPENAGKFIMWALGVYGGYAALKDRFRKRVSVRIGTGDLWSYTPISLSNDPVSPSTRTTSLLIQVVNKLDHGVRVVGIGFSRRGEKGLFVPGAKAPFNLPFEIPAHDAVSLPLPWAAIQNVSTVGKGMRVAVTVSTGDTYNSNRLRRIPAEKTTESKGSE